MVFFLDAYDYAVPEAGTLPLLSNGGEDIAPSIRNHSGSVSSRGQRNSVNNRNSHSEGKKVSTQNNVLFYSNPTMSFFLVTHSTRGFNSS